MENPNDVQFDPDEVQIPRSISYVNNRIENFMKRKQEDSNDRNSRLYCSPVSDNNYYNSSRTCVTVETKRQKKSECYVKKSKVQNISGPLSNGGFDPASEISYGLSIDSNFNGPKPDILERISNLEHCLNLPMDGYQQMNVYQKLKSIEDHVLKLESILLKTNRNCSLSDLCLSNIQTDLTNHSEIPQENLVDATEKKNTNLTVSQVIPSKSKYTVDDIKKLIDSIKEGELNNLSL